MHYLYLGGGLKGVVEDKRELGRIGGWNLFKSSCSNSDFV